jgi:hypothetical protein
MTRRYGGGGKAKHVRDIWAQKDLADAADGHFQFKNLASHDSRFLLISDVIAPVTPTLLAAGV